MMMLQKCICRESEGLLYEKVRTELDLPVATMLDTKGPEILLSLRREFPSGYPGTPIFSRFR